MAAIINETTFRILNNTSTPIQLFSKYKVDSNPKRWQQQSSSVYSLARPLTEVQPFYKWKEKRTPGIYLRMSQLHARKVALVLRL